MSMKNASTPRRLYVRGGALIVSYGGMFFGPPAHAKTELDQTLPVTIKVQKRKGGKSRISVTQMNASDDFFIENWVEQHLVYTHRASKDAIVGTTSPAESDVPATVQTTGQQGKVE
jgi:hypothetical protein